MINGILIDIRRYFIVLYSTNYYDMLIDFVIHANFKFNLGAF